MCKLAGSPRLRRQVVAGLQHKWAPEQIAGWLKREHPDDQEMWVSHEPIYRTLFIQSRGALKRELTGYLRTRRTHDRLLRQYFPKRSDLKPYSQTDLGAVAAELNGRPRKTLQFMTPSEKFAEAVASTR